MRSSSWRRTATAVAVSGQVATPSADEVSGAASPPKTRPYQVWTAAWFLASQGTPGRRAGSKKARSRSRGGAGGRPWRWSQTRSRRTPPPTSQSGGSTSRAARRASSSQGVERTSDARWSGRSGGTAMGSLRRRTGGPPAGSGPGGRCRGRWTGCRRPCGSRPSRGCSGCCWGRSSTRSAPAGGRSRRGCSAVEGHPGLGDAGGGQDRRGDVDVGDQAVVVDRYRVRTIAVRVAWTVAAVGFWLRTNGGLSDRSASR